MPTYQVFADVYGRFLVSKAELMKQLVHGGTPENFDKAKRRFETALTKRAFSGNPVSIADDGTVTSETPAVRSGLLVYIPGDLFGIGYDENVDVDLKEVKATLAAPSAVSIPGPAAAGAPAPEKYPYSLAIVVPDIYLALRYSSKFDKNDWSGFNKELAKNLDMLTTPTNYIAELVALATTARGAEFKDDPTHGRVALVPWTGTYPAPLSMTVTIDDPKRPAAAGAGGTQMQLIGRFWKLSGVDYPKPAPLFPPSTQVVDLATTPSFGKGNLQCLDNATLGGGYCSAWMQWFAMRLANSPSFWTESKEKRLVAYTDLYTRARFLKSNAVYDAVHTAVKSTHRSQRIFTSKEGTVVTTNPKKNPYAGEGEEFAFTKEFKANVLAPLASSNGFRIAVSPFVSGGYDVHARLGARSFSTYEIANLVNDTTTKTPILFFSVVGTPGGSHALCCIYFPAESLIEIVSTYPVGDMATAIKEVPMGIGDSMMMQVWGAGRKTLRKTRRRRTLRKHK